MVYGLCCLVGLNVLMYGVILTVNSIPLPIGIGAPLLHPHYGALFTILIKLSLDMQKVAWCTSLRTSTRNNVWKE